MIFPLRGNRLEARGGLVYRRPMSQPEFNDFEAFWPHFLSSHQHGLTRWMHVLGVTSGAAGIAAALVLRKKWPLALGAGMFAAFALGAHPLVEGNHAENLGRPIWGARALLRMCARTVTGTITEDLARLSKTESQG